MDNKQIAEEAFEIFGRRKHEEKTTNPDNIRPSYTAFKEACEHIISALEGRGEGESYATKEKILGRLHSTASVCGHCGKPGCSHVGYSTLPHTLRLGDVLHAVNLDN